MKKLLLSFLTFTILFGCSSNEGTTPEVFLNFKLAAIPNEYQSKYNYTDFTIKIYETKENYLKEVNPIYTGKFNASGELSATNNSILDGHVYYVDIFTNDKVVTNWTASGLNTYMPEHQKQYIGEVYISDEYIFVGEWAFVDYIDHHHQTNLDRTTRTKLIVSKDLEIKSYENYKKDILVKYRLKNNGWAKFLSMNISEVEYPFCNNSLKSPDGINLQYDKKTKLLRFNDYAAEKMWYRKK